MYDGKIPEIIPIITDIIKPKIMFPSERVIYRSILSLAITLPAKNSNKPIAPPINDSIIASNKNWNNINFRFAPNDF